MGAWSNYRCRGVLASKVRYVLCINTDVYDGF